MKSLLLTNFLKSPNAIQKNLYLPIHYFFKLFLILLISFSFNFLQADDNHINGRCPGEIIGEINGTLISASHIESGGIGSGGNDRYRMTFPIAGTLDISASNTDTNKNANYRFYISRNSCGNNDADWNIENSYNGTSPSFTVNVNEGDTIYVRLQSDKSLPNKGRHRYALSLDFTILNMLPCTTETSDNLITNSCVEESSTGWHPYGSDAAPTWVNNEGHSGTHSLKVQNITANTGWRYDDTPIDHRRTITFGGWNKSENVDENALNTIDLRVEFEDGSYIYFYPPEIRFSTGTHDWEHKELTYTFNKNVVMIRSYVLLYYHPGTAWFDDIYVISVDTVPTAESQSLLMNENTSLDITLVGTDSDGDILTYTIGIPPAHGTLSTISGNTVTYTPDTDYSGDDSFTFTANDATHSSTPATVNIHINAAPVANAGPDQTVVPESTITLDGTASSDDVGIINYSWSEPTLPINATGATPTITIDTAGTYTITLTVTDDNGLTDTDTMTIRINTSPVAYDMNFTILKNTPFTFELNATDANDDSLIHSIQSNPSHGTLSGPETNLTYTPNDNYIGLDSFTYQAYDGISYSNTATIYFEIVPPATAVHDDYNTTYLTPISGNVLTNDLGHNITLIDFNLTRDDNLTQICNLTQDFNGSLNISNDGEFIYYPYNRFAGNVGFYYTIQDDINHTSTTSVCITVFPPRNDLSITKNGPSQVDGGAAIDYVLTINSASGSIYLPALDVVVIDTLPPGVTYNGIYAPGWTCGEQGGTISCDAPSIAPGYTGTIIIHTFAPNNLGNITNHVEIDSGTPDPDRTNNTSSVTTDIRGIDVDLVLTKSVSSSTVTTTSPFFYTLSVSNQGSVEASAVTLHDELPPELGFISVDSGTDWSCGQGSIIDCTYIANGGVFPANSTSNDIIINVRAPSTTGTFTNNADTKTSNTLEINTDNNKDSVDVTITEDTNEHHDVPLEKYIQFNVNGDYALIGNTNINFINIDPNVDYNDWVDMHYVDTDGVGTTVNSSSSTQNINSNYEILWAGLYWEGHICSSTDNGSGDGANTGCDWYDSDYDSFNDATSDVTKSLGHVKLRTPDNVYHDIYANTLNTIESNSNTNTPIDWTYSAFADVTNIVTVGGNGSYTVADIVLTEGQVSFGNYGGWVLLTIYKDPSNTLNYKNISIFNGFQYIEANDTPLTVSGFLTPRSGTINASMAFFGADGDPVDGGIAKMKNTSGVFEALGNAANPTTNIMNSTMTVFGNNINSGVTKTYGVDADRLDVSTFMSHNQTQADFRFDMLLNEKTDYYSLSMFAFATDLTSPVIDDFSKSAVIINKDGTRRVADPNQPIYPGSKLEYTITFSNKGDEVAEGVEIFDDFDYDGLTLALDISHFDATKLKLFHSNTATNEVANPDCGYLVNQRRVYCNIDSMNINDSYTMQFVVSVKNQLDSTVFNNNANNTAYAKYRNPNDNTYIKRGTTPAPESEPIGGKSNSLNAGIFTDYPVNTEKVISVDAINESFSYSKNKNITTKLANTPFNIQLVHIDKDLKNTKYDMYNDNGVRRPMNVLVSIQGETKDDGSVAINPPINDPSIALFIDGDSSIISTGLRIPNAHGNIRLKMNYLDWKTILGWARPTSTCLVNEQTAVYFNGLPACFNVYHFIEDIFPKKSFPQIANCYGEGPDPIPTESTYACNSTAYDLQGEVRDTVHIFPDVYNHNFGCFHCISEGYDKFRRASTDNLAVRPVKFQLDSRNSSFPDLLRAGLDYNLSLVALDGQDNPTQDYNITQNVSNVLKTSNPKKLLPNGSLDTNKLLAGDFNLTTEQDYNISNGISTTNNTDIDEIEDVIGIRYSDVGLIQMEIHDDSWANVDADDTPLECNATKSLNNDTIETGRTICSNEMNLTFIPHHFSVSPTLHNHRDTSNVTYLSNDLNMSAHVAVNIEAQNAQNQITTNFKKDFYEHPMTVELNVTDWNASLVANLPFDRNGSDRPDVDLNKTDIRTPSLLGFGGDDANGTHNIAVNNANTSQRIRFNYKRSLSTPKNPFSIPGNEVNITVQAHYVTSKNADQGSIDINGTGVATGKANFYYARIRPSKPFYPNVTENSKQTPILIDIYCDLGYTACDTLNVDTINGEINQPNWWLSLNHNQTNNDGNISLTNPVDANLNTNNINIISQAREDNIFVTANANTGRPLTVDVNLSTINTNLWLIYNPNDDTKLPNPFYKVEFIGTSSWTGHGNTGHVVDSNASKKRTKRLGW